ncbi:Fanconi anemia group D2 protein [Acropora cervicornis]|uniref:Fanconi anemia group D2 protein n=1 Tax=Acropora cervicornis TaxID=6130 RepID=A0AAD9PR59_ACRCE|nr:Fanconi anemia group D2 protein [Acropora cervicornis]
MVRSKRRISKPSDGEPSAKRPKQKSCEARKNSAACVEATLFSKIVEDAGLQLNSDATQDELAVGRSVFQSRINKLLKGHPSYPEIIDDFIEGFEERLQDPNRFQLSLLPVSISADHEGCGGSPESLTRMLLSVDILQPKIANILLEKLPEFMGDEDSNRADGINIPRLVLNQFRWMDCVVQSKELTEKMLEMVGVTSLEVQREIISCIPEVLDDSEHTEVARELSELLLQNTELTVSILDALSNLNLRPELLSEVRSSVIQMLPSVELDDLPVVVKFILQSVGDNDAFEVISELRSNLSFSSTSLPPTACSTPAEQRRSHARSLTSKNKHGELFTLDAIRSGIRFQKSVAEGWTKAIESANTPGNHKVVDLFVLLILHSTANRKKAMETLIRNKIKNGHFTEEMLNAAFSSHSQILREYFSDLLSLAEILLRSPDPSVSSYACEMYKLSFISFDLYCQQEIVGTLVTHIGSGFASEADASLDVLSDLVESHPDVMAPFAIFIKGILDYLDNLTVTQIRKLFDMLSTLAFASRQDGGLIQDDMHIVITKQLTSNSPKYKRIGIIGAIMVVRSMAKNRIVEEGSEETMGDTESERQSTLSDEAYKQVTSMLDLIRNRISQAPEAAALSAVSLICLAPHFRLLRVCEESQRKGDLEGIDALLVTPTYKPPLASFDFEDSLVANAVSRVNGSKTKKGKKAKSGFSIKNVCKGILDRQVEAEKENANDKEDATQIDTAKNTKEKDKTTPPLVSMTHYRAFLRELDLKAFGILECELVSRAVLDSEMNTERQELIQDLAHSLSQCEPPQAGGWGWEDSPGMTEVRHDKLVGFSNLSRYSSKEVATFVVDLLPSLCEHLEATSAFFQEWFSNEPASSSFEESVVRVVIENKTVKQGFHYLEQFCASVPNISTAVSLTKLLVVLCERQRDDNSNMNTSLADLTGTFLKREWIRSDGEKETGAKLNEALQFLLRFHLSCASDTLATIEEIAGGAMTSLVEDEEKDACSEAYPTLTRSSLACFYRAMMEELVSNVKQTHSVPLRSSDPPESHKERLVKLNIAVRIFHIMINLVKAFNQRRGILGASLKDDIHGLLKNLQQSTRSLQHFCGHSKDETEENESKNGDEQSCSESF